MIEFKNISKSFGDKVVLDGVSHVMETGAAKAIESAKATMLQVRKAIGLQYY